MLIKEFTYFGAIPRLVVVESSSHGQIRHTHVLGLERVLFAVHGGRAVVLKDGKQRVEFVERVAQLHAEIRGTLVVGHRHRLRAHLIQRLHVELSIIG